jgi:hypothetical protein|tara:strand:+ start:93 stop:335 length:243 start_codon:yes stop_codon:yes gene_type:complete
MGSFFFGGGKIKVGDLTDIHPLKFFSSILLFITLKVLVVQYSYNSTAPVFIKNFGGDLRGFKLITFEQALTLIVFFMFLF